MSIRDVALRYGAYLLIRIRFAATIGNWTMVEQACDRFERLMANLPPVTKPLVWQGDYA